MKKNKVLERNKKLDIESCFHKSFVLSVLYEVQIVPSTYESAVHTLYSLFIHTGLLPRPYQLLDVF